MPVLVLVPKEKLDKSFEFVGFVDIELEEVEKDREDIEEEIEVFRE